MPLSPIITNTKSKMSFSVLNPDSPEWASYFDALPIDQRDVYYSPSFARLFQETINKGDEVCCAAMNTDEGALLYPFVKRNLGRLTGVDRLLGLCDTISLYGRGGVVGSQTALQNIDFFNQRLASYCKENSVVCSFDRFHPILKNETLASKSAKLLDVGGFVVVDLRPEMTDIENSFKHSVRKNLRKAERNDVTCIIESNGNHLKDFLDIYYQTLSRNEAREFYYFNEEFFVALCDMLAGQFHFFYAIVAGSIVSCELVLHHGKYCHSFLGGTYKEALHLCANQLLKREILSFCRQLGCEYFLLGGGQAPNDGVFNFKKAFAPKGVRPSYIGGTCWDSTTYEKLKMELPANGFEIALNRFQFYDIH
jgi:hypothetical protein